MHTFAHTHTLIFFTLYTTRAYRKRQINLSSSSIQPHWRFIINMYLIFVFTIAPHKHTCACIIKSFWCFLCIIIFTHLWEKRKTLNSGSRIYNSSSMNSRSVYTNIAYTHTCTHTHCILVCICVFIYNVRFGASLVIFMNEICAKHAQCKTLWIYYVYISTALKINKINIIHRWSLSYILPIWIYVYKYIIYFYIEPLIFRNQICVIKNLNNFIF